MNLGEFLPIFQGEKTFTAEDYMAETPEWAVFGSKERGFDPGETRFHRKNRKNNTCNDGWWIFYVMSWESFFTHTEYYDLVIKCHFHALHFVKTFNIPA